MEPTGINTIFTQRLIVPANQSETVADKEKLIQEANQISNRNLHCQLNYIRQVLLKVKSDESFTKQKNLEQISLDQALNASVDIIVAQRTFLQEMQKLFNDTEALLDKDNPLPIEKHSWFKYFSLLKNDGIITSSLVPGPDMVSFLNILLKKDGLETHKANQIDHVDINIFNNFETLFRCLDIFKTHFEEKTGNTIDIELSYTIIRFPLELYCYGPLLMHSPEILNLDELELEKIVRLLAVFNIGDDIVTPQMHLKMSVKPKTEKYRSFMPFNQQHANIQKGTNEISIGQKDLNHQIQNLDGSAESMKYIKDADGKAQMKAFASVLGRKELKIADIGGGRGETIAVIDALREAGSNIRLLNIEPVKGFAEPYTMAYQSIGINDVHVLPKYVADLSAKLVVDHFKGEKVDVVYASHSFYFEMEAMYKASLDSTMPLENHPMWKYFDMMSDDGVMVVTMQSGAGSRLFRNALLGEHGLNPPTPNVKDEVVPLLKSFGNLATFLIHFEVFAKRFEKETKKTIEIKLHHCVANVPLGEFKVGQDPESGGYVLHNPNGRDDDPAWLSPTMLNFYGNWKEQELVATLTPERLKKLSLDQKYAEQFEKLGLKNASDETFTAKRDIAKRTQETFLHILRAFAPKEVNMQHPNITLEIKIKK